MKHFICPGNCGFASQKEGFCCDRNCSNYGRYFIECSNSPEFSEKEKSKTILVTGGAGFIGSAVLRFLFNRYPRYSFIILDALTYAGDIRNIPESIRQSKNFEFHYGDIRNPKIVEHLVARADIVLHFAAETHVTRSVFDDINFFETDVIGTQRIASAVLRNKKRIQKFIHISTSEVYGTALAEKMSEDHPLNPQSPYAAAKAGADRLVYSYMATYNIPVTIIRPFNMFGPNQHLEKVIPRFITSCILNEPLTIHGSGESRRDFTYVDDLAEAINLVIQTSPETVVNQVFNVGSGKDISMKEIADLVIETMNHQSLTNPNLRYSSSPFNIGDRPGQVFRHTADTSKIEKTLGWRPRTDFKAGLKKTVDWYLANESWWRDKLWMRHVPVETEEGKTEMH